MTRMTYSEIVAHPTAGIARVVDLTWHRKDRGLPWLVVERGSGMSDGRTYWTETARLVASCATHAGARNRAGKARASLHRQHVAGRIDIVRREQVAVRTSSAPYGCYSGEGTAS